MSYKKVFPKTELKTVDVLNAEGAFNIGCYVLNGKLVPALNRILTLDPVQNKVKAAWYSPLTKKYLVFGDDAIWLSDGEMYFSIRINLRAERPSLMEIYKQGMCETTIAGDTTYFSCSDSSGGIMDFNGGVHGCVLKNGRIFGIDNTNSHKIKWSGEGGMDDWTEGISGAGWTIVQNGYGEILNLIVYKDKIVALREYGLTFLTAYGNPETYKLSYSEHTIPKIYADTAAVVNEKLWFYTDDGLYTYDGSKVEKSNIKNTDTMREPRSAACFQGKYFLCGVSKISGRRCILVVDSFLNIAYVIDLAVEAIAAGDRVFAYANGQEYEVEEGGEYSFQSGLIDFSSSGYKVLKEVVLDDAENVRLEVSNGVISRIVRGVRGKFRPNMRGKIFQITVYGNEEIKGVTAVAEVACGV